MGGAADAAVWFEQGDHVIDFEPTPTPSLFEQTNSPAAVDLFNRAHQGEGDMRVLYSWQDADVEEHTTYTRREGVHTLFYASLYLSVSREFRAALASRAP